MAYCIVMIDGGMGDFAWSRNYPDIKADLIEFLTTY